MVNGINCQNYQLLIGRKEMVVLRRAQSKTFPVILSLPRPVILSSSKDDLRSKDDPKSKDKKGVLCRKNIAIVV